MPTPSRQQLYQQAAPQIIPGAGHTTSPPLGKQAHNNLQALSRLLDAMGNDPGIDLLLLTGDLYDHVGNADPEHPDHQAIDSAKELWDALHNRHHTDPERYPRYIDALKALSLLHDFMDRFQKPLFFVDGNHEAYEVPYGISPRFDAKVTQKRLNPGIPADHGLTFFEAVLTYGPDYGHYGKKTNFTAANLAWVHTLITPWRDWAVAYGETQTFIGLGWGDDEDFIKTTLARGGSLPRATQSCSDDQLALVEDAVNGRQGRQNLLLSHFTHVNFATDIPLNQQDARIDPDDASALDYIAGGRSQHDQGSFHQNRNTLYEQYVQTGKIAYTFSGHSHRAGAYTLEDRSTWTGKIPTQAHYPHQHTHTGSGACLLVTGAGGPLSWQNREGEYRGWGMEPPQGLKLDTTSGRIEIVHDQESRPRMAVVQDYLWYEGGLPALKHALEGNDGGFSLKLSEAWVEASMHGGEMLERIRLHLHTGGKDGYQGFVEL